MIQRCSILRKRIKHKEKQKMKTVGKRKLFLFFPKTNLTVPAWFIWSTVKFTWLSISLIIWLCSLTRSTQLKGRFSETGWNTANKTMHYTSNCTFLTSSSSGSLVQKLSTTEKSQRLVLKRKTYSRSVYLVSRRGHYRIGWQSDRMKCRKWD